jgi:hypothetical protein
LKHDAFFSSTVTLGLFVALNDLLDYLLRWEFWLALLGGRVDDSRSDLGGQHE